MSTTPSVGIYYSSVSQKIQKSKANKSTSEGESLGRTDAPLLPTDSLLGSVLSVYLQRGLYASYRAAGPARWMSADLTKTMPNTTSRYVTHLGGTGYTCSSDPHPVPEKRCTALTQMGVEQVEQDKTSLGNRRTMSLLCCISEKNVVNLFHLFQGGSKERSMAISWNRVGCSMPVPPVSIEVVT